MIQIDKGIPVAAPLKRGKPALYPWADMEVGDSFFVAGEKKTTMIYNCDNRSRRHRPQKFICREVEGGVRVWRIA